MVSVLSLIFVASFIASFIFILFKCIMFMNFHDYHKNIGENGKFPSYLSLNRSFIQCYNVTTLSNMGNVMYLVTRLTVYLVNGYILINFP